MNRRGFLKRCSLIPFGLAVVAKDAQSSVICRPKPAQPGLTLAKLMEAKKALDATVDEDFLISVDYRLYMDRIRLEMAEKVANPPIVTNPNGDEVIKEYLELDYYGNWPACLIKPDGIKFIHYKDFFKTKLI